LLDEDCADNKNFSLQCEQQDHSGYQATSASENLDSPVHTSEDSQTLYAMPEFGVVLNRNLKC